MPTCRVLTFRSLAAALDVAHFHIHAGCPVYLKKKRAFRPVRLASGRTVRRLFAVVIRPNH